MAPADASSKTSTDIWTVSAALNWTLHYLETKGDEHPRVSAEWLLSQATGLSRVELYAFFERPLSMDERAKLRESIRRRAQGEPLQYVTGEVAFRHIIVKVEPGVLIPRPETEMLVEAVLPVIDAAIHERGRAQVLDLCTGTGIIALSIANEREQAHIIATDISPRAVGLARRNAQMLGLEERVEVLECDLANAVDQKLHHTFDLVIANPPYIPRQELGSLPDEVKEHEPMLALDGGRDGLELFRRIVVVGTKFLKQGGVLACELHEKTLSAAAQDCATWYQEIEILNDLTGRPRIIYAILA